MQATCFLDDGPPMALIEQYILVDMVSNLAGGGWTVVTDAGTYGQSGLVVPTEGIVLLPL